MERVSKIVDHRGQPVKVNALTQEVAAPSLTGVRTAWDANSIASGLTPSRLASILLSAQQHGNAGDYLQLAEEMEEKDPHYSAVLRTRKLAVAGLDVTVEAYADDGADQRHADLVEDVVRKPQFDNLLTDLLDALGKGYAVSEIMWSKGQVWKPVDYVWRSQRHFQFDQVAGRELRLLDDTETFNGLPLTPYKFITHIPHLKSGLPIRGGLARLVAISYMCKMYGIKDWLAFIEVFGMPIRVGRYGSSAKPDDIDKLRTAVANIGFDACAVMPESMRVEFVEAAKASGGDKLFETLTNWLDKQVSKAVLGQTMTTDAEGGNYKGEVHNDVRLDIVKFDARQLMATLNRDLVKPLIDLNFGPQENYPRIVLNVIEPEDTNMLVTALEKLIPFGLKVQGSTITDKLGLPEPDEGAETLSVSIATPTTQAARDAETAANRASSAMPDTIDTLAGDYLDDWQTQMEPVIDPVRELADQVDNYEEFVARLPELLSQMKPDELVNRLAAAAFTARGLGDSTDDL